MLEYAGFSHDSPHEIMATHYGIVTMMGGKGYLTTKLVGGL